MGMMRMAGGTGEGGVGMIGVGERGQDSKNRVWGEGWELVGNRKVREIEMKIKDIDGKDRV